VINPNQLVDDVDVVAAAIEKKGVAPDLAYAAQAAALRRRSLVSALDDLRAEMNRRSKK
jgi:hypothetical protein